MLLTMLLTIPFMSAVTIEIEGGSATPQQPIIEEREHVVWRNQDAGRVHQVIITDLNVIGQLLPGGEFGYTFTEAGEYPYVILGEPRTSGTIIVQEPAGGTPPGGMPPAPGNRSGNVTGGGAEAEALLQAIAEAQKPAKAFSAFPKINIPFHEFVSEINSTFFLVSHEIPPEEDIEAGVAPESFILEIVGKGTPKNPSRALWDIQPVHSLPPGFYLIEMKMYDRVKNELILYKPLSLNYTPMDIEIRTPKLGVSDKPNFNLIVATTKQGRPVRTQCKFGFIDPVFRFFAAGLTPSANLLGETHLFPAFSTIDKFNLEEGHRGNGFFVICMDENGEVAQKKLEVYVDTTDPVINEIRFDPPELIEFPLEGHVLNAQMEVEANEEVQCKVSFNEPLDFETQMVAFPAFDLKKFENYQSVNVLPLDDLPIPPNKRATFTYAVQCIDRAGLLSEPEIGELRVDLTRPIELYFTKPDQFTVDPRVTINFTTNKRAHCGYQLVSLSVNGTAANRTIVGTPRVVGNRTRTTTTEVTAGQIIPITTLGNPGFEHKTKVGTLEEGTHEFTVVCRNEDIDPPQETRIKRSVIIDSSPPTPAEVEGSTITCTPERFIFDPPLEFLSEDDISDVVRYHIEIEELEISKDGGEELARLNLNKDVDDRLGEGKSYSMSITAVNGVGLESDPVVAQVKYDPRHELCIEHDAPVVNFDQEPFEGGVRVAFHCFDESGCDENTFFYGTADDNALPETPSASTPGEEEFDAGAEDEETGAADTGSSASSCRPTQKLLQPLILEVRRTQTICWEVADQVGNKAKGSARIAVSLPPSCSDGTQNGNELGIDCGGICGATCSAGATCTTDGDCITDFCNLGVCAQPTCEDKIRNQGESAVDCSGPCKKCENDISCVRNDDCISNFCNAQNVCQLASCDDSVKNGQEVDADCGGTCPNKCEKGKFCLKNEDCETSKCNFGMCEEPIGLRTPGGPDEPGDGKKAKPEKGWKSLLVFIKGPWLLIILGFLFIGGGVGYLAAKQPSAHVASRGPAPTLPSRTFPTRGVAPHARAPVDMHALREQQERTEELRKIREEHTKEREEKRGKLFGKFGEGKPMHGLGLGAKEAAKESLIKPFFAERTKQKVKIMPKVYLKEEWVPLEKLHGALQAAIPKKIDASAPQQARFKEVKREAEEFERLGKITSTKKDRLVDEMVFQKQEGDLFKEMEAKTQKEMQKEKKTSKKKS